MFFGGQSSPFLPSSKLEISRVIILFSPRNFLIINLTCAQCSPRHACPLKGLLLMQAQRWPQAVPLLALAGIPGGRKTHAKPCTLWMHGLILEK